MDREDKMIHNKMAILILLFVKNLNALLTSLILAIPIDIITVFFFDAIFLNKSKLLISNEETLYLSTPILFKKSTLSISNGVEKKSIFISSAKLLLILKSFWLSSHFFKISNIGEFLPTLFSVV